MILCRPVYRRERGQDGRTELSGSRMRDERRRIPQNAEYLLVEALLVGIIHK
jgi:hypothetical protein